MLTSICRASNLAGRVHVSVRLGTAFAVALLVAPLGGTSSAYADGGNRPADRGSNSAASEKSQGGQKAAKKGQTASGNAASPRRTEAQTKKANPADNAAPPAPEGTPKKSAPSSAGATRQASPAQRGADRVVVCKYVRKPGETEVLHHVIIVDSSALEPGFTGTFPFEFRDAHFRSVAIRFAEEGEKAKDVSLPECPAVEEPPPEEPVCPDPAAVNCPDEPEIIVPEPVQPPGPPRAPQISDGEPGQVLPRTGASEDLARLLAAGALAMMLGLVLASRRKVEGTA